VVALLTDSDSLLVKKERIEMEQALARCEPASESTTVVEGEITSGELFGEECLNRLAQM
jgi:hypothetical protein